MAASQPFEYAKSIQLRHSSTHIANHFFCIESKSKLSNYRITQMTFLQSTFLHFNMEMMDLFTPVSAHRMSQAQTRTCESWCKLQVLGAQIMCSLKWKPPSENSVDFKLVLRFPASSENPGSPDFYAKPIFELHVWTGDRGGISQYESYDTMQVEDDEWERSVYLTLFYPLKPLTSVIHLYPG